MRVIAGSARRMNLRTVDSMDTRPTTDRIKETLFNMIQFDVPGTEVLDLFAGSGGIGIEALSRGAKRAVFCDNRKEAVSCIQENLVRTHLMDRAELILGDYAAALEKLKRRDYHFGLVFLDPPYGQGLCERALQRLSGKEYVDKRTVFILECALKEGVELWEAERYELIREKCYKTNKHVFLRLREERP